MPLIWVRREAKYFCNGSWTQGLENREVICPPGKIKG
jgi:hypothetical protein